MIIMIIIIPIGISTEHLTHQISMDEQNKDDGQKHYSLYKDKTKNKIQIKIEYF
jgi:hypothetical protein